MPTGVAEPLLSDCILESRTLRRLFDLLLSIDASVMLWKGVDSVEKSLSGHGDVDLLVHPDARRKVQSALTDLGFLNLQSSKWRRQYGVFDWFGADEITGTLLHVQIYHELILGSAFSRQILVPGITHLFATANRVDIPYTADAEAAVLCICRASMARSYLPGRPAQVLLGEARNLASSPESLFHAASNLFDAETAKLVVEAYESGSVRELWQRLNHRYSQEPNPGGFGVLSMLRVVFAKYNRRSLQLPVLPRRQMRCPAPVIALVGSDGSGKSTVSRLLLATLESKIDTRLIYFGTGQGQSSWLRNFLMAVGNFSERYSRSPVKRVLNQSVARSHEQHDNRQSPTLLQCVWAAVVARERLAKLHRLRRYVNAGIVVITDRYPQDEIVGIHDGPRLGALLNKPTSSLTQHLARWEQRVYRQLVERPPDLVLFLDVSPELASQRHPEVCFEELKRRIEIARTLRFGGVNRLVIDTSVPLDSVLGHCLQIVLSKIDPCT